MDLLMSLQWCLNPCCSGIWSRILDSVAKSTQKGGVLILVLIEEGLGNAL